MLLFDYFPIGFPFHPAKGETRMSLPATHRLSPEIKQLKSANLHKRDKADILAGALSFERTTTGEASSEFVTLFAKEVGVDMLDPALRKEDLTRQLNAVYALPRDDKRIGMLSMDGRYLKEFRSAHSGNKNMFANKWIADSQQWLFNDGNDMMRLILADIHQPDHKETMTSTLFGGDKELTKLILGMRYLISHYSSYSGNDTFKVQLVVCGIGTKILTADNNAQRNKGLRHLWAWAFQLECPELFLYIYAVMQDYITPERFPFLNFAVLDKVAAQLNSTHCGLNVMRHIYYSSLLVRQDDEVAAAMLCDVPSIGFSMLATKMKSTLSSHSLQDVVLSDTGLLANNFNSALPRAKRFASLHDGLDEAQALINAMLPDDAALTKLDSIPLTSPHFSRLTQRHNDTYNTFSRLEKQLAAAEKSSTTLAARERLTAITEEANALATAPLDNAQTLAALKQEHDALQETLREADTSLEQEMKETLDTMNTRLRAYRDALAAILAPASENDEQVPLVDFQQLEADLNDERTRRNEAESKLHALSQKATSPEDRSLPASNVDIQSLTPFMAKLAAKPSLNHAFALLEAMYPNMRMSPGAWRSVKSNEEFTRTDQLIELMGTLLSSRFLDTYQQEGSQACFSLITTKQLSFRESDSVDKAKLRDYRFDDGQTRTCNAHLRFGVSNDPTTMLRVYFTIENGIVFVGEVTKHAPLK